MPKGWGDTKPNNNLAKWEDSVEWYRFKGPKDNVEFNHIRLIGPIMSAAQHWVEVTKQDGKKTKFPMTCSGYDTNTEATAVQKCPACRAAINQTKFYFQNAIMRNLQEDKPARAKGLEDFPGEAEKKFREVGDKHWTPVKVVRIPSSCAVQLRDIVKLNKHKVAGRIESMDISDSEYGCDLFIKYDKDESPSSMYNVQKGDVTPLSEEEMAYKIFNLEVVVADAEKNEKDLIRLGYLAGSARSAIKDSTEDELSIDGDDTLPPAIPNEEDLIDEEEMEPAAPKEETGDQFEGMDRAALKAFNVKEKLGIKVYKPPTTTDEILRESVRKAWTQKNASKQPTCYGNYQATAKCFECDHRTTCPDDSPA